MQSFKFDAPGEVVVLNEHMSVLKLYEEFTIEFWSAITHLDPVKKHHTLFFHAFGSGTNWLDGCGNGGFGKGIWAGYTFKDGAWHFQIYRARFACCGFSIPWFDLDNNDLVILDLNLNEFNESVEMLNKWAHWAVSYNQQTGWLNVFFNGQLKTYLQVNSNEFYGPNDCTHNGITRRMFTEPEEPYNVTRGYNVFPYETNSKLYFGSTLITNHGGISMDYYPFVGYMSQIRLWNKEYPNLDKHIPQHYNHQVYYTGSQSIFDIRQNGTDIRGHSVLHENVDVVTAHDLPVHPEEIHNLQKEEKCGAITLRWEQTYSSSVKITRSPDNVVFTLHGVTEFTDYPPHPDQDYTYNVKALWNVLVNGTWTNYFSKNGVNISAQRLDMDPPSTFTASPQCDGTVILNWSAVPAATNYKVEFGDQYAYDTGTQSYQDGITGLTYTHQPNVADKNYIYTVIAKNSAGCARYLYNVANATTKTTCLTPPTNVNASIVDGNAVVNWNYIHVAGSYPNRFQLFRRDGESGEFNFVKIVDANINSYTDNEAPPCVNLYYKVQALAACGGSAASISSATTLIKKIAPLNEVFSEASGAFFSGSKGYFGDRVELEWRVNQDRIGEIEKFQILRKESATGEPQLIHTVIGNNYTNWSDLNVDANKVYTYYITAVANCEGTPVYSDTASATGFRVKTGFVSGKVSFDGGNTVENVEVRVSKGISQTSCLDFTSTQGYAVVESINALRPDSAVTVEAWIYSNGWDEGTQIVLQNSYYLYLTGGRVITGALFENNETYVESKIDFNPDTLFKNQEWHHIAFTFGSNKQSLYIDGKMMISKALSAEMKKIYYAHNPVFLIGNRGTMDLPFKGKIDEVRVWNRCKTADEISFDYARTLASNEPGLIAYWRMDENTGNYLYDCSKQDGVFNKNHAKIVGTNGFSIRTPAHDQLHPAGLTDKFGNYTIPNIPYASSGEIFSITPMKGVHRFDPVDRTLFIGDNSPVHNNIDFIDRSSFVFHGRVWYENTNFPVADAEVYIDNVQVSVGNEAVKTNQYGEFTIEVPIGDHFISVKKQGHVFKFNGQWPQPTENLPQKTFNFQDDITQIIPFWDITKVKVLGRFVGGNVEGDKKLGFNLSNNNIGIGQIVLKNDKGFDIDTETFGRDTSILSFSTNENSGEYGIELLPEKYTIVTVGNSIYQITDDLGILDLTTVPQLKQVSDTVYVRSPDGTITQEVDTVLMNSYHFERNFIYYATPSIKVYSTNHKPIKGEDSLVSFNPITEKDTVLQLEHPSSPFKYPVFLMGKIYPLTIFVFEEYINGARVDQVPVANAEVRVTNNLDIKTNTQVFQTDVNGFVPNYINFKVGLPNMSVDETSMASYTKTLSIVAKTSKSQIAWPEEGVFRAYVLGAVDAEGANFVTLGCEYPHMVIHDPPGSNSYAYIKEGSSFTMRQKTSFKMVSSSAYDNKVKFGSKFGIGGGLLGPMIESELFNNINAGITAESYTDNTGEYMEKWTFSQKISTSSDPDNVGSMADVFVGTSGNIFFTETKNLQLLPKAFCDANGLTALSVAELKTDTSMFTLGIRPGFAASPDETRTLFVYSQFHIINNLLPTYKELIKNLLAGPNYQSQLPPDHPFYGSSNESPLWNSDTIQLIDALHPSYIWLDSLPSVDSVAYLNEQIDIWMHTIALNEAAKVEAIADQNVSVDGASGPYSKESTFFTSVFDGKEFYRSLNVYGGTKTGFSVSGNGFSLDSKTSMTINSGLTGEDEETKEITWGYVIDDGNQGDYYSIDVANEHRIENFNSSSFLSANNFDKSGRNLEAMGYGLTGGGAVSAGLFLMYKFFSSSGVAPGIGNIIGMSTTVATSAIALGVMGTYNNEIESNGFGDVYSSVIHSPIFKIRGGNTRCPYEGPEYSLFYLDTIRWEPKMIHIGTQQHELPKIDIEPGDRINVPDNGKAYFTLTLTNESPTNKDLTYYLKVDENANPYGAILRLDGIDPNYRQFFIPAGQTITKTLTVEKGRDDVMEYENLGLILHSSCQFDPDNYTVNIADTVRFSVHFMPVCTQVDLYPQDDWVVNAEDKDTMTIVLSGYDLNNESFERIVFEYRSPGGSIIPVMTFVKNPGDMESIQGAKELINNRSGITWMFPMENLIDGIYEIRAKTICYGNYEYVTPWYKGVLDGIPPQPFGLAQPAGGILWPGDNISVKFNEALNEGYLYAHKELISVKGVVNGTDLQDFEHLKHNASVHFDGNEQNMYIPEGINLKYTSFTFEFWAKRERLGKECILSQGSMEEGLWIGFDENNLFSIQLNGQLVKSENAYTALNQWNHYALAFNNGNNTEEKGLSLIVHSGDNVEISYTKLDYGYFASGAISVGNCPYLDVSFQGNIHDLRLWNTNKQADEITAGLYVLNSGYEKGLMGLWPMDDVQGNLARDIAFGRNAIVNATWKVSRDGKGIALNGGYMSFNSQALAFSDKTDFTVEFWFKGAASTDTVYLFSGDMNNPNAWGIGATPSGKLFVDNYSKRANLTSFNCMDNNWHHLAIAINRRSNLNAYLDGELVASYNAEGFSGLGSDKCILGGRYTSAYSVAHVDKRFVGNMDEIRIWNSARTKTLVNAYKNHSLQGNETGLKAYYPFEDITISDPSVSEETLGNLTIDSIGISETGSFMESCVFSSETPNLKLHSPSVDINFSYVVNRDELVILPEIEENKIEHCMLEFSVKGVKDLNNNTMHSSVVWSALIDKNLLFWEKQHLSLVKNMNESLEFKQNIINQSGNTENWTITNLPVWLSVTPSEGSLDPLQTEELTFVVNPSINVGNYNQSVFLLSSMGYPERLKIDLRVKAPEPGWKVERDQFENSMSVIGKLKIGNYFSADVNDMVGAFVGEECRGVDYVTYLEAFDKYILYLDVFGNANSETIDFRIWDASEGKLYVNVDPEILFLGNEILGTFNDPLIISSDGAMSNHLELVDGWKWLSFNLQSESLSSTNNLLDGIPATNGDVIKYQNSYDLYTEGVGWIGSLSNGGGIKNDRMYLFKLSEASTLRYSGMPVSVSSTPITLGSGWNWIGYTPQVKIPINSALSYFIPEQDDVIKSQYDFAMFDKSIGWYGCLTFLEPGAGYKYKSNSAETKTFVYPVESIMKEASLDVNRVDFEPFVAEEWKDNMSMIATINEQDAWQATNKVLLAFCNELLVGMAAPQYFAIDKQQEAMYFITIYGHSDKASLKFKLAHLEDSKLSGILNVNETLTYSPDAISGTVNDPVVLSISDHTDETNPIVRLPDVVTCFPNPFTNKLRVAVQSSQKAILIEMYNVMGRRITSVFPENNQADIDLKDEDVAVPEGMYFLRIHLQDGKTLISKLIKN